MAIPDAGGIMTTTIRSHRCVALLLAMLVASASAHEEDFANRQPGEAFGSAPLLSASLRGQWGLHDGVTAISFNLPLLEDLGLRTVQVETTADTTHPRYLGFALRSPASFAFGAPGGALDALRGAHVPHRGGVVFALGDEQVSMRDFVLRGADRPGVLELVNGAGEVLFTLVNAHTYRDATTGELFVLQMDLELGRSLAGRLGTPEFEGLVVGMVDLSARVTALTADASMDPEAGECIADFGDFTVDVELTDLNAISELAREAGGRVALAPSAKLRNAGNNDIRWYWAIAPLGPNGPNLGSHPNLVMAYYRIAGGVFEQIGLSELKHAWNTTNLGCPCPGGQVMFVGCTDTYGVGNNGNQFYFGPREELTAHTVEWTSLGSHFDATPVDDFRDHGNSPVHPPFEHRLVVAEADLATPGAQYLVEAWYLVQGDQNIFNSMGFRNTSQTLVGEVWNFVFTDSSTTPGPAINAWVDPDAAGPFESNEVLDTGVGHLQLAAQVTDLGAGQFRYEYALLNLDFDRQIGAFSVPTLPGATITNVTFGDVDDDATNNWQAQIGSRAIEFASGGVNTLDWGTLYNFGFEADVGPAQTGSLLEAFEPGDAAYLALPVPGPVDAGSAADSDGDGIVDSADNCTLAGNADQRDTDGDRYGNACDPDLNNDLAVNFLDLQAMKDVFFANGDLDADLDGDGVVNFADLLIVKSLFFSMPGPSGVAPP